MNYNNIKNKAYYTITTTTRCRNRGEWWNNKIQCNNSNNNIHYRNYYYNSWNNNIYFDNEKIMMIGKIASSSFCRRMFTTTKSRTLLSSLRSPTKDDVIVFQSILLNDDNNDNNADNNHNNDNDNQLQSTKTIHKKTIRNIKDVMIVHPLLSPNNNNTNDNDDVLDILKQYNIDWTKQYNNNTCKILLKPKNVQQISKIVSYCYKQYISIIPIGGRTGLVGGTVSSSNTNTNNQYEEILLSLEHLNSIDDINDNNHNNEIIKCEGGVILENLQNYCLNVRNIILPIDIGSKGSCYMSGTIATNAGGQYYNRYGNIASNLIGIQIVTGTGIILDYNYNSNHSNIYKDNTSLYKINQLLIGSEGTLGIITGIVIHCKNKKPISKQVLLLQCYTFDHILKVIQTAKETFGEILAACEYMDSNIMNLIKKKKDISIFGEKNIDNNNILKYHYLLIETHGCNVEHDQTKMEQFMEIVMMKNQQPKEDEQEHQQDNNDDERCVDSCLVHDGIIAKDIDEMKYIWNIRESCNPTMASSGYTYKYDLSIPDGQFDDFIQSVINHVNEQIIILQKQQDDGGNDNNSNHEDLQQLLNNNIQIVYGNWGHLLDYNLHLNVTTIGIYKKNSILQNILETYIYHQIINMNGSISAEHGLGQQKNKYIKLIHTDENKLNIMKSIKDLFDPHGILNPGKFF